MISVPRYVRHHFWMVVLGLYHTYISDQRMHRSSCRAPALGVGSLSLDGAIAEYSRKVRMNLKETQQQQL